MFDWWTTLSQPQAAIISSFVNAAAALSAVYLGWVLFSEKVKDMRSALLEAGSLLKEHRENTEKALDQINQKVSGLLEKTAQLQADSSDSSDVVADEATEGAEKQNTETVDSDASSATFGELLAKWKEIRDTLEAIASDPTIPGRTAAKYARIDRRNYADLVESLNKDQRLEGKAEFFLEAARIWSSHRTQRRKPTEAVINRLNDLALLTRPNVFD